MNRLQFAQNAYEAFDQMLALSTPDRGLGSGMTGRIDVWQEVLRVVSDGSWVFGHGVRSSDTLSWLSNQMVDNSYMVILYDMGIVPLILITWRFVSLLHRATQRCLSPVQYDDKLSLTCGMFLVVLMVSSIVERDLIWSRQSVLAASVPVFTVPNRVFTLELARD